MWYVETVLLYIFIREGEKRDRSICQFELAVVVQRIIR
jgi:hypothetical protein